MATGEGWKYIYIPSSLLEKKRETTRRETETIEKPGEDTVWEVTSREGEKSGGRGRETRRNEK